MIVGLLIALLVSAVVAIPTLAKPDNGTAVKGVDCVVDASDIGLGIFKATKARWIEKRNGQVSKLKCRFKGVDMKPWEPETKRVPGVACSAPAELASQWSLVWSRLKVNHRGNGWLKCAFKPAV